MAPTPSISVVVVAYDMEREVPRTLRSLTTPYQRGIGSGDVEVILVDNGSPRPVDLTDLGGGDQVRVIRLDDARPSPARAANRGIELAGGDLIGLIVDGARIASPGLLAHARLASRLADRPVITAPGYHLGDVPHMQAVEAGYDQEVEDRLLTETDWEHDGYGLFAVSTLGGSSARGWFGPMGESSSLFLPRALWDDLGGLDEAFDLPGGGLVNHDLYRRACSLDGVELVSLLGEGTFHQFHGGAATSRRFTWEEMHAQYQALRGVAYSPPTMSPLHLGKVPTTALGHLERSVAWATRRAGAGRPVSSPDGGGSG